jgi:acetyl-CoA carboxylase/biotin carboxylase 1
MSRLVFAVIAIAACLLAANAFVLPTCGTRCMQTIKSISRPLGQTIRRQQIAAAVATVEELEAGPQLSTKKREKVKQFVEKLGGKRPIQRVLIANNGMAATKAILSMRQWAYITLGDERALEFVALATRDDLNANAEFIRLADTFVEVPSGSNKNNYANVDLIVEIAEQQKVDAVWPGWGHASENPRLPSNLKAKGIQFIGPTAPVMAALGDKVSANILAQTAEVPSIPWSGGGITSGLNEEGVIPEDVFKSACIFTADEAAATADKIGYPVMIKASEGGGGKGIRMAKDIDELKTNFIQVQNEVPGSPIFMMQLCTQARHLEVQIIGDEYGNAVALNGRDCSTQRRFQKIFEEGPPSIAPKDTFKQMERAAQRLTQSIGYIGAGTVEYLYNAADDKYYFLELNPRLQVEHPVTEGLTGVNLPSVQLQVAMGIPLYRIPEIRQFYNREPFGEDFIDFMTEDYGYPNNHVIAARITAENPDEGFKPTSGRIERVKFQSTPRVWGYFSVGQNGGIHEFADSQFGHLFASGPTREDARKALVLALKEIDVRGDIRTTVEYLIKLLETEEFKANTIDTSWLDGIIREKSVSVLLDPQTVAVSAAVFRAHSIVKAQQRELAEALAKGQTSLASIAQMLSFPIDITYDNVKYSFKGSAKGPDTYQLTIGDQTIDVKVREQPDSSLLCNVAGENYQLFGQDEALGLRMKINGATVMIPTVYNPSELRSDVTGKIVRFLQDDGTAVEKDTPYVEVEAMKMIMALKASESGKINHNLSPGSIIGAGDLIANLQLADPSKVKQIRTFTERLSSIPATTDAPTPEEALEQLNFAFDGYEYDVPQLLKIIFSNPSASTESLLETSLNLLNKFVAAEGAFAGKDDSDVVGALAKANKDNLLAIVPQLISHKQLKSRSKAVIALLKEIEVLGETSAFEMNKMPEDLKSALQMVSALSGGIYGALALKAKQLLDTATMPSFDERLSALRTEINAPGADLDELAKRPNIAVSVDLLVVLMTDDDVAVRKQAIEVYLRRVYRAHVIKSMDMKEEADGRISVSWTFTVRDGKDAQIPDRYGYMTILPDFNPEESLPAVLNEATQKLPKGSLAEPLNVLHIGFSTFPESLTEQQCSDKMAAVLRGSATQLAAMDVRTANLFLSKPGKSVSYFNFYSETGFAEDPVSRNMRPTMPYLLELSRLAKNHELERLPAVNRNSYLFLGQEKEVPEISRKGQKPQVLFLRSISLSSPDNVESAERVITMAIAELERALLDPRISPTASSRVYLNVLTDLDLGMSDVINKFEAIMDALIAKYATQLLRLRVDEIEVKIRLNDPQQGEVPIRLIASSSTGGWLKRESYREYLDPVTGQTQQYCTITGNQEICVLDPYPTANTLQMKRTIARKVGSTYAYDFLGMIEVGLIAHWQQYLESAGSSFAESPGPSNILAFDELVLQDGELSREKRFPGLNKVGMLAWHLTMKTPLYPEGRDVVLIANDVTVQSGSFGVQEDEFFYKASEYARKNGLPRIFISCNSGARIGLVDELKPKFKVAWKDDRNPSLGFEYLYLTEEDYSALAPGTVDATPKTVNGETRYALDAIIGQIHGIGVENLRGSGLIAGETSRAYDETFTLSYVTGRSVGIGAYLNRLGQRVIQMQHGPMILTGYSALNKLLGKEVYTSQDQLGGPQIMYPNGVTHEVVRNDQEGVAAIIDWLAYTPKDFASVAPVLPKGDIIDPPDREVGFQPTKTAYDPRHMLGGVTNSDGSYVSGFFDKGSFKEYLGGWGKSVVTGRARLGGINVGVIAVETRLVEQRIPADPGNPESREAIQPQAGQVWYPDSAFKTAQAIEDFNRGENLPLIIFANWRGFSGGTRDMYGEILKFGAMIVDALRTYKHPVFVYIPPNGELRGGAWVVIDPTINPDKMEMYADKDARGGILEPPGICEVKFRAPDQKAAMQRLDPVLQELESSLTAVGLTEAERATVEKDLKAREKNLMPLYTQVAHEFADLHDRAGRMKAKGCISDVLEWKSSRKFFYWRIRRRQLVDGLKDQLAEASVETLTSAEITAKVSV